MYGVTNRHVTINSSKTIDIKPDPKTRLCLGKPVIGKSDDCPDIGLVKIIKDLRNNVNNQITDKSGKVRKLKLFEGPKSKIYGNRVFQCRTSGLPSVDPVVYGRIMPEQYHEKVFGGVNSACQLCIEASVEGFAVPGDCGTAVALESSLKTETIEMVGMICGGQDGLTYCIYLPDAINWLQKHFKMQLELFMPEIELKRNMTVSTGDDVIKAWSWPLIECSSTIYFILKTPEAIAPYSFDLFEYVIRLFGMRYEEFSEDIYRDIIGQEKELKRLVNLRKALHSYPVFENDKPEYKALEEGLKATECLIAGQFKDVEKKLKIAMKCIPNCSGVALRLFPKNFTYTLWYYGLLNNAESRVQQETLIREGLDFYNQHVQSRGFPTEVGGYMHYEYSRLYIQRYDEERKLPRRNLSREMQYQELAIKEARMAVHIMTQVHNNASTALSLVRKSFVEAELAFALLRCGNDFNVGQPETLLPKADIEEAETLLKNVTKAVVRNGLLAEHAVKYCIYLVSLCDLYFRKGDTKKALSVAEDCLAFAKEKDNKRGILLSTIRIEFLRSVIKVRWLPVLCLKIKTLLSYLLYMFTDA